MESILKTSKDKRPFLATTAIQELWDTSKPLLFLGDWCLRYSRQSEWEKLQGKLIEGMWDDQSKIYDAYYYLNDVYEKVLASLSKSLNHINGVNYSNRYWRIVIGPWLFHYIHALYDRYTSLSFALKKYPNLNTFVLAENSFIVPLNSMDSVERLQDDDAYNLQIYSKILSALGKEFPSRKYDQRNIKPSKNYSTKRVLFHRLIKLFYTDKKVILSSSYFNKSDEFKIFIRTMGKVIPSMAVISPQTPLPLNMQMRTKLQEFLFDNDEFTSILKKTLPTEMPQSYLEAFNQIACQMQRSYPVTPKVIASAISWYFDEPFKQWAAYCAEKGTKLVGIQNGGGYGNFLCITVEEHELAITDKYCTWGWTQPDSSKIIPMPATKLASRKILKSNKNQKGILFISTNTSRYLYRFQHFSNNQIPEYLRWQLIFMEKISPALRSKLRLRIYQNDFGWDISNRMRDNFPDLPIESWQTPLAKSLKKSRLCIFDHLATTYLEALSVNKPTILFWDRNVFQLREEVKPYYEALHSAGILHYSAEEAAKTVNAVYDNIESWWSEPYRQSARKNFCNQHARTSDNAIDEWAFELKKIANDS